MLNRTGPRKRPIREDLCTLGDWDICYSYYDAFKIQQYGIIAITIVKSRSNKLMVSSITILIRNNQKSLFRTLAIIISDFASTISFKISTSSFSLSFTVISLNIEFSW